MNRKDPCYNDWAKRIVAIVSQYPMLYDRKHSEYKDKGRKACIWKDIAAYIGREMQVNMTAAELEKRWLGWKSTFIAEHRRLHTLPVDPNVKKWYLYKSMQFMEPYISHHRKTLNNCEAFNHDDGSKSEYGESLMKPPVTPLPVRPCMCGPHEHPSSFPCPMVKQQLMIQEHSYLSHEALRKSEAADSTTLSAISQVVSSFDPHHEVKSMLDQRQTGTHYYFP